MKQERTEDENTGSIGSQLETIFRVTLFAVLEDELRPPHPLHNSIFIFGYAGSFS